MLARTTNGFGSGMLDLDLDPFFNDMLRYWPQTNRFEDYRGFDVTKTDDGLVIETDLPGVMTNDLSVSINDGLLRVDATRHTASGERKITRSMTLDRRRYNHESIDAILRDGVLKIMVARLPDSGQKKIDVRIE